MNWKDELMQGIAWSEQRRRRSTAWHEAGHVVMAKLYGWRVAKVTIDPACCPAGLNGVTEIGGNVRPPESYGERARRFPAKIGAVRWQAARQIHVMLAGLVAEHISDPVSEYVSEKLSREDYGDARHVREIARGIDPDDLDRQSQWLGECWEATRSLLIIPSRWDAVGRISEALSEGRTLMYRDVEKSIRLMDSTTCTSPIP